MADNYFIIQHTKHYPYNPNKCKKNSKWYFYFIRRRLSGPDHSKRWRQLLYDNFLWRISQSYDMAIK